jgi:hypothetical protein
MRLPAPSSILPASMDVTGIAGSRRSGRRLAREQGPGRAHLASRRSEGAAAEEASWTAGAGNRFAHPASLRPTRQLSELRDRCATLTNNLGQKIGQANI